MRGCPTCRVYTWGLFLMPKNLKRYSGRGDLHFVTFCCYGRLPQLRTAHARNPFLHTLAKIRERYRFRLVGYVAGGESLRS